MTSKHVPRLSAFACTLALTFGAACSGGGITPSSSAPSRPIPQRKLGTIQASVFIPYKRHKGRVRGDRRPRFLPYQTTQIDFVLVSHNGNAYGGNLFNFTIYVSGSNPNCTLTGSGINQGWSCSATWAAPAGADRYKIVASACNGDVSEYGACPGSQTSSTLSESSIVITVPAGGTTTGHFTLDPVVASIGWSGSSQTYPNGPHEPGIGEGYYACSYASSGCYDPMVDPGVPSTDDVSIVAYDATGATIVPSASSVYGVPLYLQSNGAADAITWVCNDNSLNLETGGGPFPSNVPIANGEYGNGIDTPVVSPAYATGTDFLGNVVNAVGNDGSQLNYDGTDQPYDYADVWTCTASDLQGKSSTFYVGLVPGYSPS